VKFRSCGRRTHNPTMSASRGIRTGTVIGTVGGAVRAAGSFAPMLIASDDARTRLYVGIDTCLALGLLSLYLARRQGMRAAGTVGSFLALGGLIAGRIGPVMTDLDLYPVTAAAVAVGVLMLASSEWQMRRMAAWIPLTFALSLVVGSIGTFVAGASAVFILSGILFGCAFAAMTITAF
jgi:hypothetical protein